MLSGLGVAHAQTAETPPAANGGQQQAAPQQPAQQQPAQPTMTQVPPASTPGAQQQPVTPVLPAPQEHVVKSLQVEGEQRIDPSTILSYTKLRVGQPYTTVTIDQAIKDLLSSDFLADVSIEGVETGNLIIHVKENPIINRVILEGNKRLKSDKIQKEIKLAPRQIFTRTAVRADVARIIELYRRQGRFGATVDPQMVKLSQNRVDVVFDIHEGPKSKVTAINIIGNHVFSDAKLRSEMATKQAKWFRLFSSNTSYDQDRMAYDQQKLRQFYLTEGYADFRVVSAVAELTPNKRDFIITYVVEEGKRYKFGPITVDSGIRTLDGDKLQKALSIKEGQWYNAKEVEDTVDQLTQTAGLAGYAFANVRPSFQPDRKDLTMGIDFVIGEAKRTYVENVNITGNTNTKDKVIRREMRLAEGDPFNAFLVKRSENRINSLGYFQDKFDIKQKKGSADDRIDLDANVEEKATGELSLSAGYSSLERFLIQASIRQRNFRGMGQTAYATVNYSYYSKSIEAGFTEPYLFDKPIALGGTIFRRDYNSFNYIGDSRNTVYSQVSTGFNIFSSIPLTEYWSLTGRYTLSEDDVSLDQATYYTNGVCDPLKGGRYLCEAIGNRLTSAVGLQLRYSSLNSYMFPTAGHYIQLGVDFAGLGGDVHYIRGQAQGRKYWNLGSGFIFNVSAEGGYIHSLDKSPGNGVDPVRITDRFYLGEPQFAGFDIRGVGPRIQRIYYNGEDPASGNQLLVTGKNNISDDPLGGKAYYLGKAELQIPLGSAGSSLGLRPSIFVQVGALFGLTRPKPTATFTQATDSNGNLLYNADGSPSLEPLPLTTTVNGASVPLYINTYTTDAGTAATRYTTCATGYADSYGGTCSGSTANVLSVGTQPFVERYLGDSASPRVAIGFGVNWNSPFGPLRINVAKAILTQPGDDPKLFTFNVGTSFQ